MDLKSIHNTNNEENVDFELEINIEEEGPPEKKGKGVAPKMSFKHGWKLIHKCEYPIIMLNGEQHRMVCQIQRRYTICKGMQ